MIKYSLRCANEHEFEAWFRDSAGYDEQANAGDVECPFCGDAQVSKALMAPALSKGRGGAAAEERARQVAEEILDAVKTIRKHVEDSCDYVGDQFADEARKIHYGESDERGIYGEASDQEAEELKDEGIQFFRLPTSPRRGG